MCRARNYSLPIRDLGSRVGARSVRFRASRFRVKDLGSRFRARSVRFRASGFRVQDKR